MKCWTKPLQPLSLARVAGTVKPGKQEHTFLKKQTGKVLINEVLMTFSGCGSYGKDTCDYDDYIATVYIMY